MKMITDGGKVCRKCLVYQPRSEFYAHRDGRDGHLNHCKTCARGIAKFSFRRRTRTAVGLQLNPDMVAARPDDLLDHKDALVEALDRIGRATIVELAAIVYRSPTRVREALHAMEEKGKVRRAAKRGRSFMWEHVSAAAGGSRE